MDPKKQFSDLLKKPMNRKEFLVHIGAVTLGMLGISGLIRNLSDPYSAKTTKQTGIAGQGRYNYNRGAYGGQRK